jgi:hypothetical protein
MVAVPLDQVELDPGEKLVELRKGQWAVIADPEDVPERKRRPIIEMAAGAGAQREELAGIAKIVGAREAGEINVEEVPTPSADVLAMMTGMVDLLIVACVSRWSFDYPCTAETVPDLPGADYDALRDATSPLFDRLVPDFSMNSGVERKEDGSPGRVIPDSPTAPSGDSTTH